MNRDEMVGWLRVAYQMAAKSPDLSTRNGAVLISPAGELIGSGCNRIVPESCLTPERLQRPLKYDWTRHAEVDTVLDAVSSGRSPVGATLVACWSSCAHCGTVVVGSGVKRVVRHRHEFMASQANWLASIAVADEMFAAAGIEVIDVHDRLGVTTLFGGIEVEV